MKKATEKTEDPREKAKQMYKCQLDRLEELVWKLDCYYVGELNRIKEEKINFGHCGFLSSVIETLQEAVNKVEGKEE